MINRTVASVIFLASTMPAMAHPGDHADVPVHKIAGHLASSPFHLVLAAFGLAALAAIVTRINRASRTRVKQDV